MGAFCLSKTPPAPRKKRKTPDVASDVFIKRKVKNAQLILDLIRSRPSALQAATFLKNWRSDNWIRCRLHCAKVIGSVFQQQTKHTPCLCARLTAGSDTGAVERGSSNILRSRSLCICCFQYFTRFRNVLQYILISFYELSYHHIVDFLIFWRSARYFYE